MSVKLTGKQRSTLRGKAHGLRPVVQVGQRGMREGVVQAIDAALLDHELIKVRLHLPADKKAAARELAEATGSELCGMVGHTVILYRPHPETPKIQLTQTG